MEVNLVLLKKNGSRKNFSLPSTVTVIGRRQDCDLCVPLMLVSRRHCEINQDQGVLKIRDLGSRNGTYVNGKRVDEADIQAGDYVQVGPVTFGFQIDDKPKEISLPDWAKQPQEPAPGDKSAFADSGTFAGLSELDSSQGNNGTESLDELFDIDPDELGQ